MGSDEYKVVTEHVAVELRLRGGPTRAVELYTPRVAGVSAVDALLGVLDRSAFLACRDPDNDEWFAWRRDALLWLAVPFSAGEIDELYDTRHAVRVVLEDGSALDGAVLYSSPAERSRVLDHLNEPGALLRLWGELRLYLVHKGAIARVVDVEA